MSARTWGCVRPMVPGRTVSHAAACRPGVPCGPGCESVCPTCAGKIRDLGWHDDGLGNLRPVAP